MVALALSTAAWALSTSVWETRPIWKSSWMLASFSWAWVTCWESRADWLS